MYHRRQKRGPGEHWCPNSKDIWLKMLRNELIITDWPPPVAGIFQYLYVFVHITGDNVFHFKIIIILFFIFLSCVFNQLIKLKISFFWFSNKCVIFADYLLKIILMNYFLLVHLNKIIRYKFKWKYFF